MKCEFNLKRFGKYFVYDLKQSVKKVNSFIFLPVAMPLIMEILTRITNETGPQIDSRTGIFTTILFLLVIICPARLYGGLTVKDKGTEWLMLPASRGEKFFSMELISLFLLPLYFIATYLLTDWVISLFDKTIAFTIFDNMKVNLGPDGLTRVSSLPLLYLSTCESCAVFLTGALLIKKPRFKISGTLLSIFLFIFISAACLKKLCSIEWIEKFLDFLRGMNAEQTIRSFTTFTIALFVVTIGVFSTINWFKTKNLEH